VPILQPIALSLQPVKQPLPRPPLEKGRENKLGRGRVNSSDNFFSTPPFGFLKILPLHESSFFLPPSCQEGGHRGEMKNPSQPSFSFSLVP